MIDEIYIEFSNQKSFTNLLEYYPNLAVCQTFSKAQGMAGADWAWHLPIQDISIT